ncbi:MAG: glycosyltransferase family 39 protein [Pirellulaceae bacterium]|nr:glycosyltransferase family 39 protein [Pirellulaceae bacterium]
MSELLAKRKSVLILVLGIALATRVGAAFWWQARLPDARAFAYGDSASYWVLAQHIVRGEPYCYGIDQSPVFRTPGYPLLLAGLFCVTGDDPPAIWARLLGAVIGTATIGGLIYLTRQLFDTRAALVAGLLAAIYPGSIGMSVFVLSESPFCLVMVTQLICWVKLARSTEGSWKIGWSVAIGALAGIATLIRPSWLLFTPFALGVGALFGRRSRQDAVQAAIILLAIVVTMSPWWIRNYRVTGGLVATTLQMGASLYDGLNPTATGASDMRFVAAFHQAQQQADATAPTKLVGTFSQRLDDRMRAAALDWARTHPGQVVRLMVIKFARMWSPWPHAEEMQNWTFRLIVVLGFVPLLGLALWGAFRNIRGGWPYGLCLLPAVYFSVLHMIFVSSIRYRQPAMLPLIVLAAAAVCACLPLWKPATETNDLPRSP